MVFDAFWGSGTLPLSALMHPTVFPLPRIDRSIEHRREVQKIVAGGQLKVEAMHRLRDAILTAHQRYLTA